MGPFSVRAYGTLLFAGLVVFHLTYVRLARLEGRAGDALAIAAVGGALVGALVVGPGLGGALPSLDAPLSTLLAVPLGALALAATARALRVAPLRALDHAALAFLPAMLVARLGCALVHDHLGAPAYAPLAVSFATGPRYDLGVLEWLGLLPLAAGARALRAPLLALGARAPGRVACLVAGAYSLLRVVVEGFAEATPSAAALASGGALALSIGAYAALRPPPP